MGNYIIKWGKIKILGKKLRKKLLKNSEKNKIKKKNCGKKIVGIILAKNSKKMAKKKLVEIFLKKKYNSSRHFPRTFT